MVRVLCLLIITQALRANMDMSLNGQSIRSDLIQEWVLRTDLTPVPRTLELSLQLHPSYTIAEGDLIRSGVELLDYRVLKIQREPNTGLVRGESALQFQRVYAALDSCAELSFRQRRGVILENPSLSEAYRSCGATAAFTADISGNRFYCFKGSVPSFAIAEFLQEQSAVVVLRDKKLSAIRLNELLKPEPKALIGQVTSSGATASEYMRRHEIPEFYSVDDDGNFVTGNNSKTRGVLFAPLKNALELHNMTRVLVVTDTVLSRLDESIRAGDVVSVNGVKKVVVTSANYANRLNGNTEVATKFWLGEVSN